MNGQTTTLDARLASRYTVLGKRGCSQDQLKPGKSRTSGVDKRRDIYKRRVFS